MQPEGKSLKERAVNLQVADSSNLHGLQDLDILADFPKTKEYFNNLKSRDSWKKTEYSEDIVISGWKDHIDAKKKA